MTMLCGIDEAGRGPVIGPLVSAGVVIDSADEDKLRKLGVKDSKLIPREKREAMFDAILKIVKRYEINVQEPADIDAALIDPGTNLNWLEADTQAEIINKLKPEKVIVDCPSNNVEAYTEYIRKKLNVDCELICEHKADMNHLVVGAASILAKVTRDKAIEDIKKEVGQDIGSGYPADPVTKAFIADNYKKYPKIFRKTWKTYKNLVAEKQQKGLGDF
ncbi:ribonuclease HII [Nanoarchaeota archaeon]